MNTPTPQLPLRSEVLDEAAAWLVECQAGGLTLKQRKDFDTWLRGSPEHVRAYLELLPLWEGSAQLDRTKQPEVHTLVEWARDVTPNVVPLEGRVVQRVGRAERNEVLQKRRGAAVPPVRRLASGALAASVLALLVCGWLYVQHNVYSTGVGEQRAITLADGSVVELNAKSRIRLHFGSAERGVELIEGQALFRVAHDTARPFIVNSGSAHIRAVGTQFDVYRKSNDTTITVVEGRVAVARTANRATTDNSLGSISPLLLSAGEQVRVSAAGSARPVAIDPARATAWTQKRLIFSGTPLLEVAGEFNRYNTRPLVLDGPDIAALRINGVFSSTDPMTLLAFLREQPGVSVTESEKEIRVTHH